MRGRAGVGVRQAAAHALVLSRAHSQQIIKPVAPLALRLQAILLKGIVTLHLRQLVFLEMDAENAVARFKSQCEAAQQEDQHVLAKKKSSARCVPGASGVVGYSARRPRPRLRLGELLTARFSLADATAPRRRAAHARSTACARRGAAARRGRPRSGV